MFDRWRRPSESEATAQDQPGRPPAGFDVDAVPVRLRDEVWNAVGARDRWAAVVGTLSPGPLRDSLSSMGDRIDLAVAQVWATAVRVGEIERVVSGLDVEGATTAYKDARRRATAGTVPPEMAALEQRFQATQRILNQITYAEERLRVADAQLLAVVARSAEVAVSSDAGSMVALDDELTAVTAQLDSLRQALADLN